MHFLQVINSDLSVLIVCNKTGGTIKGDIKKKSLLSVECCFAMAIMDLISRIQVGRFHPFCRPRRPLGRVEV